MKTTFLYILIFKNQDFIKIGITTSIPTRLKKIQNDVEYLEIDFEKSFVITHKSNIDIKFLERNLLRISKNYFQEIPNRPDLQEYRKKESLDILFNFIKHQSDFGINYKIFDGIDICGNHKHNLPKAYFPPNIQSNGGISQVLLRDLESYAKSKNLNYANLINEIIFEKIKELKIDRKEEYFQKNKNVFKI